MKYKDELNVLYVAGFLCNVYFEKEVRDFKLLYSRFSSLSYIISTSLDRQQDMIGGLGFFVVENIHV